VINYAYFLAKHGYKYSDPQALKLTHQTFERLQYSLLNASNALAKERGACSGFQDTKMAVGSLPIDRYKKDLDNIVDGQYLCDWAELRQKIKEYGLRNSTVSALMPSETSAQIANATNGIEPPRALVSVKASKDGTLKQVVPEIETLGSQYELLWDQPNNAGYLQLVAVMQKFIDQSISANTSYQPDQFPGRKVPMQTLLADLLSAYKLGLKTLYYHNTRDGSAAKHTNENTESCESGACAI
jgi:ribonucleoside-diphosphate reductase alpha chain